MQPPTLRLPHSGLTVPDDGYTVTAYKELKTHDGVAFTATLRLNRKIIGTIENEGMGGPDTFHANDAITYGRHTAALETFAAGCIDAEGGVPDVEYLLGDLVIEYQTSRDIARAAKRGNTLVRLLQDHEDDNGPLGWAGETDLLEIPLTAAANRGSCAPVCSATPGWRRPRSGGGRSGKPTRAAGPTSPTGPATSPPTATSEGEDRT